VEILEIYISKHFKSLHYIDMCDRLQVTGLYPSEERLGEQGGCTALDAVMKKETSATNSSKIGLFRIQPSH
jgi:hypothetical protein